MSNDTPHPINLTQQRLSICFTCPLRISKPYAPDICGSCKCILMLKARIESQHCPQGKW